MLHSLTTALLAFGPAGVFVLAVLDSAGIPLPAAIDLLVVAVAWKSPDRGWITAACATIGSLGGNLALFLAARHGGRRWVKVPEPGKPQKFRQWFRRFGLVTVFVPCVVPMVPLPLKVFVVSAGVLHTGTPQFFAVVLLARVTRYFGEAFLAMRLGEEGAKAFLKGNAWAMAAIVLVLLVGLFILVRLNDRRKSAGASRGEAPHPAEPLR